MSKDNYYLNMSEKYFIYNKRSGLCLSIIENGINSRFIEGPYDEMLSVLESIQDKDDLEIISENDYVKRQMELLKNEEFLKASDILSSQIYEEIHSSLKGTSIGEQIKYTTDYHNRVINGFPYTTRFDNENMAEPLWEKLNHFQDSMENNIAFNFDETLLNDISDNIRHIKRAWNSYKDGEIEKATQVIREILAKYINDPFIVSTLNESYALRQMACFDKLNYESIDAGIISQNASKKYETMKDHALTLYRGRISEKPLLNRKELLHRPYVGNEKIPRQRFTCAGIPALYLCSTSYGCWLECGKPENGFYISCFTPKADGLKLKVLNLLDNQSLINGMGAYDNMAHMDIQRKLISLLPLTMATSCKYAEGKNEDQYIIPELVMRALYQTGIDGIAYISTHLDSDLQFQIGINIAFPVYKDHLIEGGYGKICRYFDMTEPVLYDKSMTYTYTESGSYIYDIYYKEVEDYKWKPPINKEDGAEEYGITQFAKFDNYLANQKMKCAL